MYAPRGRGASPIHFHCVSHAKRGGEGVQIACKIAYILNRRPLSKKIGKIYQFALHVQIVKLLENKNNLNKIKF